jgi:hypothetical protein
MLNFKASFLPIIGRFFRHKNDIDIFVEDANDTEFYLALLSRITSKMGLKLGKILSLGNRDNVVNACLHDQAQRDTKRLYIIDADLYLITNDNPKGLKHLFIHDGYCIENFLIDENAFLEIMHDGYIMPKEILKKTFTFDNFLKEISQPLVDLFLHYALVFKLQLPIQTVKYSVAHLCKQVSNVTVLDSVKVNTRIDSLKIELLKSISEEDYNEKIYALRQQWTSNKDVLLKIVSAKDYILPLFHFRFSKITGGKSFKITRESLRLRLAKICCLKKLIPLETFIYNI